MKPTVLALLILLLLACTPKASTVLNDESPTPGHERLHDIWALEAVGGKDVDFTDESRQLRHATLEINLTENRVFGNDGCNEFNGAIETVGEGELLLGPLATTRMACPSMDIPGRVTAALNEVAGYRLDGLKLTLVDGAGTPLLRYRKVD